MKETDVVTEIIVIQSVALILSGFFLVFVGWALLPVRRRSHSLFRRLNHALALSTMAFIIGVEYAEEGDLLKTQEYIGAMTLFSLTIFVIGYLLPFVSTIICGSFLSLVVGSSLIIGVIRPHVQQGGFLDEQDQYYFIVGIIAVGALISLFLTYFSARIFSSLILVCTGSIFLVWGVSCPFQIPTILIAFVIPDFLEGCQASSNDSPEVAAFYVVVIILTFIGVLFQLLIAAIFRQHVKKKKEEETYTKTFKENVTHQFSYLLRQTGAERLEEYRKKLGKMKERLERRIIESSYLKQDSSQDNMFHACSHILNKDPAAIRKEVVQWLHKHRNRRPIQENVYGSNKTISELFDIVYKSNQNQNHSNNNSNSNYSHSSNNNYNNNNVKNNNHRQLIQNDDDIIAEDENSNYLTRLAREESYQGDILVLYAMIEMYKVRAKIITSFPIEQFEFTLVPARREFSYDEDLPLPAGSIQMANSKLLSNTSNSSRNEVRSMNIELEPLLEDDYYDSEDFDPDFTDYRGRNRSNQSNRSGRGGKNRKKERPEAKKPKSNELPELHLYFDGERFGALYQEPPKEIDLEDVRADLESPYIMAPSEPQMRERHPSGSAKESQLALLLILLTGSWWLIYLPLWGQDYVPLLQRDSDTEEETSGWQVFCGVIGFLLFYLAEVINFTLGILYHTNFFYPIERRWKSWQHIKQLNATPRADCLIFHYTEDLQSTQQTLDGCLKMNNGGNRIQTDVYICDDGFWRNCPGAKTNKATRLSPFSRLLELCSLFKDCTLRILGSPFVPLRAKYSQQVSNTKSERPLITESTDASVCNERDLLAFIKETFGREPEPRGLMMKRTIMQTMKIHFQQMASRENNTEQIYIKWNAKLKVAAKYKPKDKNHPLYRKLGYISRTDCATGSMCYTFRVMVGNKQTDQQFKQRACVKLIARLKPPKHHNKAGNANNCLYNEMNQDPYRFVVFLDNDMRPEPPFLVRTLPFFYQQRKDHCVLDTSVAFVQTPQHFTKGTLPPVLDYLASKNSIFFQAIQKGRDGLDSCAFAGTNAIFRTGALYAIGGVPYGSQTEDALAGSILHQQGYKSVYADEVLCIGDAPDTVASAMKQRMRWCKGSVQILLLELFDLKREDITVFQAGLEPRKEETPKQEQRGKHTSSLTKWLQLMFRLDTMLYPVSAVTAICYMLVALLFVWSSVAPVTFTTRFGYVAFAGTFVPYFLARFYASYSSYSGKVDADEIWISQQVWFGYAFSACVGIVDAIREHTTGNGMKWTATGTNARHSWLEYFNVFMVFSLGVGIVVRFVHMFLSPASTLIDFGAIFFAGTVVFQMWPMVSMSLYEWTRSEDDKEDFGRYQIPTFLSYVILLMLVIGIGFLGENAGCEDSTVNPTGEYAN